MQYLFWFCRYKIERELDKKENSPIMKTDTSMNVMLVVFCVILIGFVMLNSRMCEAMNKKQAAYQQTQAK